MYTMPEIVYQEASPKVSPQLPHWRQTIYLPTLQTGFHTVIQHENAYEEM